MKQSKSFLYLPIDDRPCNYIFPRLLSQVMNLNIILPPHETPDSSLLSWLSQNKKKTRGNIISLDRWIYGGLFESRECRIDFKIAQQKLYQLKEFFGEVPRIPLYAYSVLMRNSPSIMKEDDLEIARKIVDLSQALDKRQRAGENLNEDIKNLFRQIPSHLWRDYMKCRSRNYKINKECIQLAREGFFQTLVIAIDDTSQWGLNVRERLKLERQVKISSGNIYLLPGVDEIGMLLLMRMVLKRLKLSPAFFVSYSTPFGNSALLRYEDRPLDKLISDQIRLINARVTISGDDADIMLFVNSPWDIQREITDTSSTPPLTRNKLLAWLEDINFWIKAGKAVAIADVAYSNGADINFVEELINKISVSSLFGFAAWNTAGNTIGTVLVQSLARWLSSRMHLNLEERLEAEKAHFLFLFMRFLEDWGYQAIIRQEVNEELMRRGISQYNLGEFLYQEMEQHIKEKLCNFGSRLFDTQFKGIRRVFQDGLQVKTLTLSSFMDCKVKLPWKRTFEIELEPVLEFNVVS